MNAVPTELPEVLLLSPAVARDQRGEFFEAWRDERYRPLLGSMAFVQDSVSVSRRGVLRGLHLQHPSGQGKLVSVLRGEAFDVVVDVRRGSPRFGRHVGVTLESSRRQQLWIPPGFAHGFQALTDELVFQYKSTEPYLPQCEVTIRWDDPALGIRWPLAQPVLSPRDAGAGGLDAVASRLPEWHTAGD